jgi:hypothetical protein
MAGRMPTWYWFRSTLSDVGSDAPLQGHPRPDTGTRAGVRSSGLAWVRVAEILNELGVPTALAGRQWYPSTAHNAALPYGRDMARIASRSD